MLWNVFVWRCRHTLQILTNSQHSCGTDIISTWERKEMNRAVSPHMSEWLGWQQGPAHHDSPAHARSTCYHSQECTICPLHRLVSPQVRDQACRVGITTVAAWILKISGLKHYLSPPLISEVPDVAFWSLSLSIGSLICHQLLRRLNVELNLSNASASINNIIITVI